MNYRNKTVITNVIQSTDPDLVKQANLVSLFEHAVRRVAMMQARKAEFYTSDFPTAMQRKCLDISFEVTRHQEASGSLFFTGIFAKGEYRLSLIGRFD